MTPTKSRNVWALAVLVAAAAVASYAEPWMSVNGANGDYLTLHYFIDEDVGDTETIYVDFYPNEGNVTEAQVWCNLNRRDYASMADADLNPTPGWGGTNYWVAILLSNDGNNKWSVSLPVEKTGAYRLTCRYKVSGDGNWRWYGGRNTAIVVSPKKARDLIMYELMVNTVNATGDDFGSRSTFDELRTNTSGRCDLNYLKWLGVNTIWMQPIHPIGSHYCVSETPGSPYSIQNMWQVAPHHSWGNTRDASMTAFTNFSARASEMGIDVFFDVIFNHSSWDAEIERDPANPTNLYSTPTSLIKNVRPQWYSRFTGSSLPCGEYDYNQADFDYSNYAQNSGQLGPAPAERSDFGKWPDVADLFWGTYNALYNPQTDSDSYWNTEPAISGADIKNMVEYFAYFGQYWVQKSQGTLGGFRCDYAQGLPPQAWEFIINKVRQLKWDFIFMAESLDGGNVSARACRHMDIVNENWVWAVLENGGTASGLRGIIDARNGWYGYAGILRGLINHDQNAPDDYWWTFSRYAVGACVHGTPQMYQGQELKYYNHYGFSQFRNQFDRWIPNIKVWHNMNDLWNNKDVVLQWAYKRLNNARLRAPSTRLFEQYCLDQKGGGVNEDIFSVMKYSNHGWDAADQEVVLCFVNLDPWNARSGTFEINVPPVYLNPTNTYNVRNLFADAYTNYVWGSPQTGQQLRDNGLYVSFPADGNANPETAFVQFLKLERAGSYTSTPPPSPLWIGNTTTYPGPTHGDNPTLDSWEDLWVDTETWPIEAGQAVTIVYSNSVDGFWQTKSVDWNYNDSPNSHWHVNLGKFPANTLIRFALEAVNPSTNKWDNNSGNDYTIQVSSAIAPCDTNKDVKAVFNAGYSPNPPTSDSNFVVEIHSWPQAMDQRADVVFCFGDCDNSTNWAGAEMYWIENYEYIGTNGSVYTNINTRWGYNFGKLPTGTTVEWALAVGNPACTNQLWDNNGGDNYKAAIEQADDSDYDGMPDSWELLQFGNLTNDPWGDFDQDRKSNNDEYWSGTDATNAEQYLCIVSNSLATNASGGITIGWLGMPQKTYQVHVSYTDVEGPYATSAVRSTIGSTPYTITVTDTNAAFLDHGYYRVVVPY